MQKEPKYEPGDIKIEEQGAHYEPEDDLAWRHNRNESSLSSALTTKSPMSIIAIGVGVLAMIIVCLILILPWKLSSQEKTSSPNPEVNQQTVQPVELIEINQRLKTLDAKYQNIETFKQRLDDLEKSLALRLSQMESKLAAIQASFEQQTPKTKARPEPQASEKPSPTPQPTQAVQATTAEATPRPTPVVTPAPDNPTTQPKFTRKHYHKVSANETLFSISRRYNMDVDELRALNKLKKGETIQTGQILIVNLGAND